MPDGVCKRFSLFGAQLHCERCSERQESEQLGSRWGCWEGRLCRAGYPISAIRMIACLVSAAALKRAEGVRIQLARASKAHWPLQHATWQVLHAPSRMQQSGVQGWGGGRRRREGGGYYLHTPSKNGAVVGADHVGAVHKHVLAATCAGCSFACMPAVHVVSMFPHGLHTQPTAMRARDVAVLRVPIGSMKPKPFSSFQIFTVPALLPAVLVFPRAGAPL
jgi:hypothetical protein